QTVVQTVHRDPLAKSRFVTDFLGSGDVDRIIIEWRSLLRQVAHAEMEDWPRWKGLQDLARTFLRETRSPTVTDLPPMEYAQTRRVDLQLRLRRH
ncbi:MAG: DEAD/DEAH box helicase, partial [Verrucomicrobiae bacterium]|nr:DEAD/DEAH box helicase [Verrucomicrobiae bacterium]